VLLSCGGGQALISSSVTLEGA